jgi:hypothetical protein
MADTDFSQFNPGAANQDTDSTYPGDSQRTGGAPTNATFASVLANKVFYQSSTWNRAMALMMVGKGYSPKDGTSPYVADASSNAAVTALLAVLNNIITNADLQNAGSPYAAMRIVTQALTDNSTLAASTAYVKGQNYAAGASAGQLVQGGAGSGGAVTFPTAFSGTPGVSITEFGGSCNLISVSSTGFTYNFSGSSSISWVAVGPK